MLSTYLKHPTVVYQTAAKKVYYLIPTHCILEFCITQKQEPTFGNQISVFKMTQPMCMIRSDSIKNVNGSFSYTSGSMSSVIFEKKNTCVLNMLCSH